MKLVKLLPWLKKNCEKLLSIPLLLSTIVFTVNVYTATLDDGVITDQEFRQLTESASGVDMVILAVVMAVLKIKK